MNCNVGPECTNQRCIDQSTTPAVHPNTATPENGTVIAKGASGSEDLRQKCLPHRLKIAE